ncbi:MAG: hypothetical protein WCI97_10370 [Bacteroidota bacterium]
MNKTFLGFCFLLVTFLSVTAQSRVEEKTQILQFNVQTNTTSKTVTAVQLLQSKVIDEKIKPETYSLNEEGTMQFELMDATGKIIYSAKLDNPCFINYEYANEKGELSRYKTTEPQATMLVKIPLAENAVTLKVYQNDIDGKQLLISSFTKQNTDWK